MDATDHMLVDRAQGGDVEAFAELARRHQAAARACAFAVTLRSELAEDLTQDAFLIAWEKLDTLSDPERFAA